MFCFGTSILLAAFVRIQPEAEEDVNVGIPSETILFYYDDKFATVLHEMGENNYCVYLPSFTDISDLTVKIENEKAIFSSDFDTFSVYKEKKNKCAFHTEGSYEMLFYDEEDNLIEEENVIFMVSLICQLYIYLRNQVLLRL